MLTIDWKAIKLLSTRIRWSILLLLDGIRTISDPLRYIHYIGLMRECLNDAREELNSLQFTLMESKVKELASEPVVHHYPFHIVQTLF